MKRSLPAALMLVFVAMAWLVPLSAQPTFKAPPPRFTDPERRTKLAGGYAEVDRIFSEFVTRSHVPGAAWGIVVDGELAHSRRDGLSRRRSRRRRSRRHGVPHRVDDEELHRDLDPEAARRRQAVARRSGRALRAGDEGARRTRRRDSPRITIRHLLSHAEGFPEDNPWGDRQLADTDEQLSA